MTLPDPLPNSLPRPPGEFEALKRAWATPKGFGFITEVNNTYIGSYYIATSLAFFVFAGVMALIIRVQLAVPEAGLVEEGLYNQLFTMHGTVMMFLFAVPAVEATAVYLLPNMLAARDMPFPRLGAFAFWAYAIGGSVFLTSILYDVAPDGGWFMYPPLTNRTFSPGLGPDMYLLGIGFIEISAIAGALEIVVGVMLTRAPGMSIDRMPIYAWAMLVFAGMVIFAFPAVILATTLLELERAFDWPFFVAGRGGDPLLWQHLFWFFGHPEVYIIFLPAAGMVSMIVPTVAGAPLVGYRLVVLAVVATGVLSFGLWVHHMFATGLPQMSLSFFSAASMAVAIPSGIQVFAWIATIAAGRMRLTTPGLFILGFLFIFTIGGLTGVMVAMVPFDWQAHDTYFIVAHLHYVLIGGMVFPFFAALYYWIPVASTRPLSERLGRWVFGLMFVGTNVTFFPMHVTGLLGMPRRVYTYPEELGWGGLNLLSSAGAFLLAAGVALFLVDLLRNFRLTNEDNAGNVWNAGTLEWLPNGLYATRSIPAVEGRDPLWDNPRVSDEVEAGGWYLPGTITGRREALVTSPLLAEPRYVLVVPGPGWAHLLAAVFVAAFFLVLTTEALVIAGICGVAALASMIVWAWQLDPGPLTAPADIGGGLTVPVYASGPSGHTWWAMGTLIVFSATLYACLVFSYLFLWLVNPGDWPPAGTVLPGPLLPVVSLLAYGGASGLLVLADRALRAGAVGRLRLALFAAAPLTMAGFLVDLSSLLGAGLSPKAHAFGAMSLLVVAFQGVLGFVLLIVTLFVLARSLTGRLDAVRRNAFDVAMLYTFYGTAQGAAGLVVVHLLPRVLALP